VSFFRFGLLALIVQFAPVATDATDATDARTKNISAEQFRYVSGSLSVNAWRFVDQLPGKHPVVVFNHGGTAGLNEHAKRRCRDLAASGFYVLASSFRGEDGSDGQIEIAAGEVDDVLAALPTLDQDKRADTHRIGLLGVSHGALISLQAAKRSKRFRALVFAYGVANIDTWYDYLASHNLVGTDAQSVALFGGDDAARAVRFNQRRGTDNLQQLDANLAILLVQGGLDDIVPPAQIHFLQTALRAAKRTARLRLDPDAGHAYLIRSPLNSPAEKKQAAAAWRQIIEFLQTNLRANKA
jgi:dipeptidyl aminopeptidase/acylaminoacyl peptidase